MIKTKDGKTTASGTKEELLKGFSATAEALMRRAPITAEELIKAVKTAEMFAKIADLIDGIEEIDEDEESITATPKKRETGNRGRTGRGKDCSEKRWGKGREI